MTAVVIQQLPESPPLGPPLAGGWRRTARILFIFFAIAVMFATESWIYRIGLDSSGPWWKQLARHLPPWLAWAALTPLVLAMARRYPLERRRRVTTLGRHLVAAVVLAPMQVGLTIGLQLLVDGWFDVYTSDANDLMARLPTILLAGSLDVPLVYGLIVGITWTIDYYRKFRERELAASQLEVQLARSRLQVLSMRLRPHFLFNTLNAIAELMHRDVATAERTLLQLSDLLRLALVETADQETELATELELVQRYLEIEQVRYGERLRTRLDVPPELLQARVPSLLLQPLVENAVRHGIAPKAGGGTVELIVRAEDDRLVLTVGDDGVGPPGPEVEPAGHGIGLGTTRQRLQALYGQNQGAYFAVPPGGGLTVRLELPLQFGHAPAVEGTREAPSSGGGRRAAGA